MTAVAPTILATSGGLRRGSRTALAFGPLMLRAIELARVGERRPKLCHVGTAGGDDRAFSATFAEAGHAAGVEVVHCNLFPMPPVERLGDLLCSMDVIWVGGGSVANLLALWRLHGLDVAMRAAWESGVVLAGVSAGSICWHVGGTTDSFTPELSPVTNGLALLPYGNGVHYDSEVRRRPLLHELVATGVLPDSYATDDGVGLHYEGTELVEAVTEVVGKGAYRITRAGKRAIEERIEPRPLSGASPGALPRASSGR